MTTRISLSEALADLCDRTCDRCIREIAGQQCSCPPPETPPEARPLEIQKRWFNLPMPRCERCEFMLLIQAIEHLVPAEDVPNGSKSRTWIWMGAVRKSASTAANMNRSSRRFACLTHAGRLVDRCQMSHCCPCFWFRILRGTEGRGLRGRVPTGRLLPVPTVRYTPVAGGWSEFGGKVAAPKPELLRRRWDGGLETDLR